MAIALVQQAKGTNTRDTITVTITAPAAGNLLVAVVTSVSLANAITGITGGGVTWVKAKSSAVKWEADIWYGRNSSGSGTSIVATLNPGFGLSEDMVVSEWSGLDTAATVLGNVQSGSGQSASLRSGTVTPASAAQCLVIGAGVSNGNQTSGPINAWTNFTTPDGSCYAAYKIITSPDGVATQQAGWDDGGNYATWDCVIAEFRIAASAAASPLQPFMPSNQAVQRAANW